VVEPDPITEPTVNDVPAEVFDGVLQIPNVAEGGPISIVVPPNWATEANITDVPVVDIDQGRALNGVPRSTYTISGADQVTALGIRGGGILGIQPRALTVEGNGRTRLNFDVYGPLGVQLTGSFKEVTCQTGASALIDANDAHVDVLGGYVEGGLVQFPYVGQSSLVRTGSWGTIQVNGEDVPPAPIDIVAKPGAGVTPEEVPLDSVGGLATEPLGTEASVNELPDALSDLEPLGRYRAPGPQGDRSPASQPA